MRKKFVLSACLVMGMALLGSCGGPQHLKLSSVDTDTIYVAKDGSIELVDVEDFDKDYYSQSELKDFIKDSIDTYTETADSGTVKMLDLSVKDKVAKVLLSMDSADTYTGFQGENLRLVSVEEAAGDNLVLPETFKSAKDGSSVAKDEILSQSGLQFLVVSEELSIQLEGEIVYYSDASLTGDNVVETTGDKTAVIVFK